MILVNLIQSASAFHQCDCNILLQCNSPAMWLNNINCPEFKTGGELFQIKVLELLMIFQNIWSCFISFLESLIHISGSNKLNEFNSDNSLFIELLPLLAGFDIAVLAFAIQFFAEIFNRLQNEAGQYRSRKMILTDKLERDFKYLSTCFGSHLVLTLLLIFVSSIKFMHENISFLVGSSFLLMLFTFFLIFYAIRFCQKLIFKDSRNLDVERVIERLDELMSIHKL